MPTWGGNEAGYGGFGAENPPVVGVKHTVLWEGQGWRRSNGYVLSLVSPILGNETTAFDLPGNAFITGSVDLGFAGDGLDSTDSTAGDMLNSTVGTVELWFYKVGNPGSNGIFWESPEVSGVAARLWTWTLNTTGTVSFAARVTGPTTQTVTSAALANATWYHLVAVRDGTNLILYVNGVNVASTASTVAWELISQTVLMRVQYPGADVLLAEMAVYPANALSATRVAAHYTAGTARGFPHQDPGLRVADTLDAVDNHAPRSLQTGTREMTAAYMESNTALNHIRAATACEKPDGMFFAARDGVLTFLASAHRASGRWNTTQVTFGDEGTAGTIPYVDFDSDYSDSWITNIYQVAKAQRGTNTQTVSDAASISRYDEIAQTITDLPLRLNSDAFDIATAYLAKYKEPILRGNSLTLNTVDPNVTEAVFGLELGDRVRIVRTVPGHDLGGGGLGWFDQTMYVQKIEVSGSNDGGPWTMRLAVSPV